MYVWPGCKKQFCDCRFVKYRNQVNHLERRDNLSPITFGQYRAALAFQPGYLIIGIDSNYQQIPQGASALKIAHVPGMQKVEAPVSENNAPPFFLFSVYASHKGLTFKDKRSRINHFHDPAPHHLSLKVVRNPALSSRVLP
jgi:hypothetical protein